MEDEARVSNRGQFRGFMRMSMKELKVQTEES
jgi:hypothetical protein